MVRVHLGIVRSLRHPVWPMSRTCVARRFAGVRFGVGSLQMLLVPLHIFGRVLVAVLDSSLCSCAGGGMFRYGLGFVVSFSRFRSRCSSANFLCSLAGLVSLIE